MNNYRTNCNNRRVMSGSSPCMPNMQNYHTQRMENMQDNYHNRVCTDMQNSRETECERSSNGTQNCQMNPCGCNDVQRTPSCNNSSNEMQSNVNNTCECKEVACEQSCNCSCNHSPNNNCECNDTQNKQECNCSCNESQTNQNNNCTMSETSACRPEPTLCEFPIGMAYVPIQQWRRLYDICAAFRNGTLFQELNLDFLGRRCN